MRTVQDSGLCDRSRFVTTTTTTIKSFKKKEENMHAKQHEMIEEMDHACTNIIIWCILLTLQKNIKMHTQIMYITQRTTTVTVNMNSNKHRINNNNEKKKSKSLQIEKQKVIQSSKITV